MNYVRERWYRYFVCWWILAFLWATVIQGFFPEMVASHTIWGFTPGWQHEISIWNFSLVCILIGVLRARVPLGKTVIPGLCVLFTLLGFNHLDSVLDNPDGHGGLIVILNFIPVLAVLVLKIATRKSKTFNL